jgi:hypothetical protein
MQLWKDLRYWKGKTRDNPVLTKTPSQSHTVTITNKADFLVIYYISMDSTGKALVVLSALTVAALAWYVGQRWIAVPSGSLGSSMSSQSLASPAQTSTDLASAKSKEDSDAARLQALLKGQNAAALAAAQTAAANADAALDSAFADEYSQAYDAVYNKTDALFKNAKTDPNIIVPTESADIKATIDAKRQEIGILLADWKPADAPVVAAYLAELETIVENITPGNSGLTQAQINAYEVLIQTAAQQVNNAITTVATDQAAANLANDELAVQKAAGDPNAITTAEQAVNNDQQTVAGLEAELAAEEAAAGNSGVGTTTDTTNNGDNNGNNNSGTPGNGNGNNPGNGGYFYNSNNVSEQQAEFQQVLKNNPPELLNF